MRSALAHAASLPYRGAQLDELLQLLEENDYENLRHARAEHVKGPMTWARLAGLADRKRESKSSKSEKSSSRHPSTASIIDLSRSTSVLARWPRPSHTSDSRIGKPID